MTSLPASTDNAGSASPAIDAGDDFLRHVRRAAASVLGDSPVGRKVAALSDQHAAARRLVIQDRSGGVAVVGVVGATGQGKSWLIKQWIHGSVAADAIRSGNDLDQATEKLTWIGPYPPADLDSRHERFVHCESAEMQDLGVPYLLVDAPGSTDHRGAIAAVAARALSLASVLLVVVRRDQMRSYTVGQLAQASEGTVVVPVVNAVRELDDALAADVDSLVARLRRAAPTSEVASAVLLDDYELEGRSERDTGALAATKSAARVREALGNGWAGDQRRTTRLTALDARYRTSLHGVLRDHLPGLTMAVERLNDAATRLPAEVAHDLVGPGSSLRAAIRSRLRLALLTETPAIFFPYRSQLGLLNLTHGAWDRVIMSLSGSLPSLVGAIWGSAQNLAQHRGAEQDLRDGLRRRSSAAIADRLTPLAASFRSELIRLQREPGRVSGLGREMTESSQPATLTGLDALQERSQQIFDDEIGRVAVSRLTGVLTAAIGTLIFWGLMIGPIVALYYGYFSASYAAVHDLNGDLEAFPRPDVSMMLTSLLLSLLPTAIYAMLIVSIAQARGRVDRAEARIRAAHDQAIERLQRDGVLRLQWDDPLLSDAEFLLSAGRAAPTQRAAKPEVSG